MKGETTDPGWNPQAQPRQFDGTGALSEFLIHQLRLVTELNGWTEQEKGMYLEVSLSRSALKILETVDRSALDGYNSCWRLWNGDTNQLTQWGCSAPSSMPSTRDRRRC